MDIAPFNEELYRLRFREYLREKDKKVRQSENNFLIADTYTSQRSSLSRQIPQDIGEIKHPAMDEEAAIQAVAQEDVPGIVETGEKKASDDGYRFVLYNTAFSPWETRRKMEDLVRKKKRTRSPCPHCNAENLCSRPFIRCGERVQYSTRETKKQRLMPHRCGYDPAASGSFIIVVDKDAQFREFLKSTCVLFLGYPEEKILQAASGKEAVALLSRCKVDNNQCGVVVSSVGLPGMNGFELVNEIFQRNFDTDVILMKEKREHAKKPDQYAGDTEIVPGEPLVKAVLVKPFHSDDFVKTVKPLLSKPPR